MTELAVRGGKPICTTPFPAYPMPGDQAEIDAATRVLRSGNLTAQRGPEVGEFDEAWAAYNGVAHAVACSNGTTALHIALRAAQVGTGDEVIVAPLSFLATATSVLMNNAIPVFADVEPDSMGLNPKAVSAKVTPRTRAIMMVHLNGYPADMDGLMAVAKQHNLVLIEDCAHAHGAEYKGRKVGTLGDLGCFSFQHKKNLSLGEGGAVITNDAELAERARATRSFGTGLGFNYRMTELHAAIGKVRLERLDDMNAQRQANAACLDEHLSKLPGFAPQEVRQGATGVYYNYMLRYDPEVVGVPRDVFVDALREEGVPLDAVYTPIYNHATFETLDCYGRGCPFTCPLYPAPEDEKPTYESGICPVAEDLGHRTSLGVKVHPPCTEREMAIVVGAFEKILANIDELKNARQESP